MMVYEVIRSTSISKVEEDVCLKMANGWIPQGGVSIDSDNWYYQAMVYAPNSDNWYYHAMVHAPRR